MTFLLLIAGALVTSNQAGLSVPDWPTSFGHIFKIPPMVGGVKYEHSHRMIAELVGVLTLLLASSIAWGKNRRARRFLFYAFLFSTLATALVFGLFPQYRGREIGPHDYLGGLSAFLLVSTIATFLPFHQSRNWMRWLGWIGLVGVIVQGVLGGLTVRMMLPWYVSTAHAAVAQTFFCLLVVMALFTSRGWIEDEGAPVRREGISLFSLCLLSLVVLYLQLFFGAAFRHGGMSIAYHIFNAVVVTGVLVWTSVRGMIEGRDVPALRTPARLVHGLLWVQIGLGFAAYMTRVKWGADAPQPLPSMVASTVAHVGVGALLLAATFVLAIQTRRHVLSAATEAAPARESESTA